MGGLFEGPHLIVILIIALVLFGPKKLPQLGKAIGKSLKEFKDAASGISKELDDAVDEDEARKRAAGQSARVGAGQEMAGASQAASPLQGGAVKPAEVLAKGPDMHANPSVEAGHSGGQSV
jgi:sec-independent protein translocase protein TatA